MKKVWKRIASKGYMIVMVLFVAAVGMIYSVVLKGDNETAGNPMEDRQNTTEKLVFPEETEELWKSSEEEVLVKKETEETQAEEAEESYGMETEEPVQTPSSLPEATVEPEATPEPVEESVEEPTSESKPTTTPDTIPEPTMEPIAESVVVSETTLEPTEEPESELMTEPSIEPTLEPTPAPTPEPAPPTEEPCVHHWLFDSYFQEPTCSNGGLENQICARCGETRTVPGTPTGEHKFVVETQGDCCSAEVVRCEDCNSREVREKNPSNHIDVEDGICYGCGTKTE